MEWESKFSSIVRDTESNLAKVKQRLAHGRSVHINGALDSSYRGDIVSQAWNNSGDGLENIESAMNHSKNNIVEFKDRVYPAGDAHVPLNHSPGVVALLQDKLEAQATAIDKLTTAVQNLHAERDSYQSQVTSLRGEISVLNSRLVERGVDLETEKKIGKWRQEMMNEIQMMQSKFEMFQNRENSAHSSANAGLSRGLNELRSFTKDEVDVIWREVNHSKSRLNRIEGKLGEVATENSQLKGSQQDLHHNFAGLMASQLSTSNDFSRKIGDYEKERGEITDLKSSIRSLHDSLEKMQSRIKEDSRPRPTKAKKPTTKAIRPSSQIDFQDIDTDLDLSSAEFDLGDVQTAEDFSDMMSFNPRPKSRQKSGHFNMSSLDLGDVTTADDLSDIDPLSIDDL